MTKFAFGQSWPFLNLHLNKTSCNRWLLRLRSRMPRNRRRRWFSIVKNIENEKIVKRETIVQRQSLFLQQSWTFMVYELLSNNDIGGIDKRGGIWNEVELRWEEVRQGVERIRLQTAAPAAGRFRRKIRGVCFPPEVLMDFSTGIWFWPKKYETNYVATMYRQPYNL